MFRCIPILLLIAAFSSASTVDLAGNDRDPFQSPARARIFIFLRTDCPISNRYAPELRRFLNQFEDQSIELWLVYPDPSETARDVSKHVATYGFPGNPLRDPHHELVKRAHANATPEAAVFDAEGKLVYHGRIDDLWVDVGTARPMARTHDLEDAVSAVIEGRPVRQPETRAIGCSLADVK